jgi:hypothetical protein
VRAFLGYLRLTAAAIGVAFLGATFLRMGRGDAFDAFRVCIESPATPRPGAMSTPACLAATAPAGTAAASQPHCCLPAARWLPAWMRFGFLLWTDPSHALASSRADAAGLYYSTWTIGSGSWLSFHAWLVGLARHSFSLPV